MRRNPHNNYKILAPVNFQNAEETEFSKTQFSAGFGFEIDLEYIQLKNTALTSLYQMSHLHI